MPSVTPADPPVRPPTAQPRCTLADMRTSALARTLGVALLVALALSPSGPATDGAPPAPAGVLPGYRLPLDPPAPVVHPFRAPADRWSAGHRGVDLAADAGAAVLAPGDGFVSFAGQVAGRPVLTLTHPGGRRSSLEPVIASVELGQAVVAGQVVGTLGDGALSHCAPASCLHWGVRADQTYLDPLSLLPGSGPVVLLGSGHGPVDQQTRSASRIW